MKKLDIRDIQLCCLEIAKEFAKICDKHNIPYYMLEGTMLGAIRHKGFIPWDDDMDFGVPLEHFDEVLELLKKELPAPYKCSTYKDSNCVFFSHFKVEDTSTILDDKQLPFELEKKIGINIDVFPLVHCNKEIGKFQKVWKLSYRSGLIYANSRTHKLINVCKSIIRLVWPVSKKQYNDRIFYILKNLESGPYLGNICGRWKIKEIVPFNWYGVGTMYQFEDTEFAGVLEYDKYLNQVYGNYMKMPPKNQQFVHSSNAYKK